MKLMKLVVSLLLLSCLAAAGAVGRKISDYTETLTPQDAWFFEIAVPGVTNYRVGFGTIVTGVVARVPAISVGSNNAVENLNGKATNTAFYTAMNLAGPALPMTSNAVDVGSFLLPMRTNWVNAVSVKDRIDFPASGNVRVGSRAGVSLTTGVGNTTVGNDALTLSTSHNYNTGIGTGALSNNTAEGSTAVGNGALQNNTTGTANTAMGWRALVSNTTGNYNTAVGKDTLFANTTGSGNGAFGETVLRQNTTGAGNNGVGEAALYNNVTGDNNTGIGSFALSLNTNGAHNTALGKLALYNNNSGDHNVASGYQALYSNKGSQNTANGSGALYNNTTGIDNGGFGQYALFANTTGNGNIGIGRLAGGNITTGSSNTVIGNNVDASSATAAQTLNICNLIFATGVDGSGSTISSGNVGIGTLAATAKLDVAGQVRGASAIFTNMPGSGDHVAVNAHGLLMRTNITGGSVPSTNADIYISLEVFGHHLVSSNLWVTGTISGASLSVVDFYANNLILTNALGSNQVRLGHQDLTNYSENPFVISGVGGANTNFTLQAGQPEVIINAFTNVSLRGIMGGSATKVDYIRVTMTNGSGTDRTLEFSPSTNSFRFSSTVGTNAPSVITNMTQLHATFRVSGSNVLVKADYYPWP